MNDPTAIPIDFDPRARRMRGVAVHGNTPFDVPFISEITPTLWLGGCTDGLVLPAHIHHVVSLYPWEQYRLGRELLSIMQVRLYDDASLPPDPEQVDAIARWVNVCSQFVPTLVHCQAGLNRSALVVARALILNGMAPDDAIALLREKRSPAVLCNSTFESWLRESA